MDLYEHSLHGKSEGYEMEVASLSICLFLELCNFELFTYQPILGLVSHSP